MGSEPIRERPVFRAVAFLRSLNSARPERFRAGPQDLIARLKSAPGADETRRSARRVSTTRSRVGHGRARHSHARFGTPALLGEAPAFERPSRSHHTNSWGRLR